MRRGLGHHGGATAEEHIDAAHRAAEDGDCGRVATQLRYAEDHGSKVGERRDQLLAQCRQVRGESLRGGESSGGWVELGLAAAAGGFLGWWLTRKNRG